MHDVYLPYAIYTAKANNNSEDNDDDHEKNRIKINTHVDIAETLNRPDNGVMLLIESEHFFGSFVVFCTLYVHES